MYPEVSEIICREKIYTDCSDYDNFKKALTEINQVLSAYGMRLIVFEDFVYCDCQYTILMVEKAFADKIMPLWESENLETYL